MKKKTKKKPKIWKMYVRSENQGGVSDWHEIPDAIGGENIPSGAWSELEKAVDEETVANYKELLDFSHTQIAALADELEISIAAEQYLGHAADNLSKSLDECAILNDELRCDLEFAALRIEGRDQTIELKSEQIQTLKVYVEYLHESLRKTGKYLGATNQKSQDIWSPEWIRQGEVLRKELEAVDILV